MNIADRVAFDVECLRDYFARLLSFAEASSRTPPPSHSSETQFLPLGIAYLVRPDMACNVYSLADFWLAELCLYHQRRRRLSPSFEDFKKVNRKSSDLARYKKYLTNIAGLDLSAVEVSFRGIDALRQVRNVFIHGGGHVPETKRRQIEGIPQVSLQASLVVVTDQFVWEALDHASQFLQAVARA
jgi:hypothetical protein